MKCPNCEEDCERLEVDVGPGVIPAGPWECPACGWSEEPPEWLTILGLSPKTTDPDRA